VEGRKSNDEVASANRANSVGDVNPSGSVSIALDGSIGSMISGVLLVRSAGADELENPRDGVGGKSDRG
jgi:hypothetical protein